MARKKIYSEAKRSLNLTLTDTAIKWLEVQQIQLTANSLSDAIERMARKLPKKSIQSLTSSSTPKERTK